MKYLIIVSIISASLICGCEANASDIIYRGMNPDITPTASPFNETSVANIANINRPNAKTASNTQTEAQLLKESVISGLSSTYQSLLTGSSPASGRVDFGDGSYAMYSTAGNTRTITFYDLDGHQTVISFPIS